MTKKQGINYVGLLIGPKGTNQKRLEQESGCKILVRGKGTQKEAEGRRRPGAVCPGDCRTAENTVADRARKAPHRPCAKAAERSGGGLLHKCAGDGQAVPCRPREVPAMRQMCIGMSRGQHQRRKGQASAMAPQRKSAGKPYKRARLHGLLQLLSPLSDKGHSLRTPHKKQGTVLLQSR